MTDRNLLIAAKKGDQRAREQLLISLGKVIQRQAAHLTYYNLSLEWDDLTAVGLIAANDAIDLYNIDSGVDFQHFASRIIRNKMVDYLRSFGTFTRNDVAKYKRGELTLNKEELSLEALLEEGITLKGEDALLVELEAAVAQLPPRLKKVLQLRYVDNFTVKESAEIMGVTPGRISQLVGEALEMLRCSLGIELQRGDQGTGNA
ncbi:sigma-70 family RNA polymerase sigma factor [Coprothermobacteraceae bacterium]|nr:sigma-70 family RNA polymerase sigma factor [Coprothermobacteraceae bacterium]